MSLFNDKLKQIPLKEFLIIFLILFLIQYILNIFNIVHISSNWIYIFIIFYFIFKLRGEIFTAGEDIGAVLSPVCLRDIIYIVVLNIFFSYGMLYLSDYVLGVYASFNLFNSFVMGSFISVVIVSPICEELIFRGVFLNNLSRIVPVLFAVLISSLLFAALHPFGSIVSAFIFGICIALLYLKFDNIFAAFAAHFLNNLFAEVIFRLDSQQILFTDTYVVLVMSVLAVISFVLILRYIFHCREILL